MSQCYIRANLIQIHQPVQEMACKQESVTQTPTLTPMPTARIRTKNNMSPSPSVGDIKMWMSRMNIVKINLFLIPRQTDEEDAPEEPQS